nr:autophagy-related protein 13 [Quercus suber]
MPGRDRAWTCPRTPKERRAMLMRERGQKCPVRRIVRTPSSTKSYRYVGAAAGEDFFVVVTDPRRPEFLYQSRVDDMFGARDVAPSAYEEWGYKAEPMGEFSFPFFATTSHQFFIGIAALSAERGKGHAQFNLVLDETDVLNEALMPWKGQNLLGTTPPPLVVEVYVDTAQLNHNQALAVEDDQGNLWNVADTMADSQDSDTALTRNGNPYCEVVLERWTISLDSASSVDADDPTDQLPNVYKKGVVLFRSLYTYLRLLPTWKLYRRLGRQAGNQQSLKLKFRIRQQREGVAEDPKDPLAAPLYPSPSTSSYRSGKHRHTDGYVGRRRFEPLVCSAGRLHLVVDYRSSQALSVADSESLLSTRFVGLDQSQRQTHFTNNAGRSLPGARSSEHYAQGSYGASQTGNKSGNRVPRALLGAYGSLNTFHTTGKRDSPITEISRHHLYDEDDSMDRRHTIRDEIRPRSRPSSDLIVNPPFKAGSLASSPRPDDGRPGSIRISRSPPMPIPAKQPTQISSFPVQRLTDGRTPPHLPRRASPIAAAERLNRGYSPSDLAVASSGSSNAFGGGMTAPKYSSSFANRPRRLTPASGGDNQSAGSSGASGQIPAPRSPITSSGAASSGTAANDDDDIASFIADLKKTELRSSGKPAVPKSFSVNLAQFDKLKDGSAALADEMELSTANLTTSTPPSRRLSNVPGLSTSSSPSRAIAAHAPHVRSRLSAHSIAEEGIYVRHISVLATLRGEPLLIKIWIRKRKASSFPSSAERTRQVERRKEADIRRADAVAIAMLCVYSIGGQRMWAKRYGAEDAERLFRTSHRRGTGRRRDGGWQMERRVVVDTLVTVRAGTLAWQEVYGTKNWCDFSFVPLSESTRDCQGAASSSSGMGIMLQIETISCARCREAGRLGRTSGVW